MCDESITIIKHLLLIYFLCVSHFCIIVPGVEVARVAGGRCRVQEEGGDYFYLIPLLHRPSPRPEMETYVLYSVLRHNLAIALVAMPLKQSDTR